MDDGHPFLLHFGGSIFDIAPRTSTARSTADELYFLSRVDTESPLAVLHGPEALPSCTCMVPVSYDHSATHDFATHRTSSSPNTFIPISLAAFGLPGQS